MPSEKTTRQGQAWDQLAKDAYGDELRLGTLFPENVDELDVLIFGGDVRVAAPEAGTNLTMRRSSRRLRYSARQRSASLASMRTIPSPATAARARFRYGKPVRNLSIWRSICSGLNPCSSICRISCGVSMRAFVERTSKVSEFSAKTVPFARERNRFRSSGPGRSRFGKSCFNA